MKRWLADIHYRAENDTVVVPHDIEELEDIHDLVERGPDWNTIVEIRITLQRVCTPGLTLERANDL